MKTFYCSQSGFEGKWCSGELEVVRWICDLFGLSFKDNFEKLLTQIRNIIRYRPLRHPDLKVEIALI